MISKLKSFKASSSEEGFTLIELMIVVVIIGILAAIAVPIFMNQQKAALSATVKSDVKNATTVMVTESVKSGGKFPSKLPESVTTSNGVVLSLAKTTGPLVTNPNLNKPVVGNQMNWAMFEQEFLVNTGTSSITTNKPGTTTGAEQYYFYPLTGGDKQEFISLIKEICAGANSYASSGCGNKTLLDVEKYDVMWETAKTNGQVIVAFRSVNNNPNFLAPKAYGSFGANGYSVLPEPSSLYYAESGEKLAKSLPKFPLKADVDNSIWGSPTATDPSKYCLEGYHKDNPDVIYSFNSNVGKVREGKC